MKAIVKFYINDEIREWTVDYFKNISIFDESVEIEYYSNYLLEIENGYTKDQMLVNKVEIPKTRFISFELVKE